MIHSLTVIDDFCGDVHELRTYALDCGKFETVIHDGFEYPGIWRFRSQAIEKLIRAYPGLEDAKVLESFFRLNKEGESATSWIHADIGLGNMAIVWYLNDDERGGTSFWRHKELGWDRLPPNFDKDPEYIADILRKDSNDESKWDHLMTVPARFNRMIIYPTACFHARMPKESFGTDRKDSRLIFVAFLVV